MNRQQHAQPVVSSQATPSGPSGVLQRACACGQHSTAGEECESCRKQREGRIQRVAAMGLSAPPPPPNHGPGYDLSRIPVSQPGDPAEREAESVAQQVVQALNGKPFGPPAALRLHPVAPLVQRQAAAEAAPTITPAETTPQAAGAGLLVEDDAETLGPGQLRKSEFLAQLRAEVCAASDAALARVGRSTEGCPYLDRWFAYYEQQSSAHVERAIRRYAPETASASSARDYIPPVVARVRQGVERWARTGEISGVPEELASTMGGLGGLGMRVAGAFGGAVGGLVRGIGSLFFMAQPGGPRPADPQTVQARLGAGQPLESATRTRMERAFGADFGAVRVHRDANAAHLASDLQARAFTLGKNVAFGTGEYQPGTLPGDALLAHELAHVVQQGGAAAQVAPLEAGSSGSHALEHDADQAAGGVLARLWGGAQGAAADLARNAVPRLRSGLRLQRCAARQTQVRVQPRSFGELAGLSPWDLAHVAPETFTSLASSGASSGPGLQDYARASRLAQAIFAQYQISSDPDATTTPVIGREPTADELAILDRNFGRVLALPGVRGAMGQAGGRSVPTAAGTSTPSLRGKVRVARNTSEYGLKRYQLEMLVVGMGGYPTAELDRDMPSVWQQFGVSIAPGSTPIVTAQERRLLVLASKVAIVENPGFYHPRDDVIYLAPNTDLTRSGPVDVARHESVHLLSAGERVRNAFAARYGTPGYIPYWATFNEGVTEMLARESAPPGQAPASSTTSTSTSGNTTVTVETGPGYDREVGIVQRIMGDPEVGRERLLNAYFTGTIPERIFQLLEQELGRP